MREANSKNANSSLLDFWNVSDQPHVSEFNSRRTWSMFACSIMYDAGGPNRNLNFPDKHCIQEKNLSSPFEACKVGWGSKISSDHIKIWCYWHDSLVIFRSFFHINFLNAVWQEWGHNTQNVVQFLSYYFSNRKRPWGGRLSMFNITFCWLSLSHPFLFSLVKYAVWRALSVAKRRYKIAPLAAPLVTGLCPILIIIICSMLLLSFSNFEGGRPSDALSLGYSW